MTNFYFGLKYSGGDLSNAGSEIDFKIATRKTASLEANNSKKNRELEKTASLEPRVCEGLV